MNEKISRRLENAIKQIFGNKKIFGDNKGEQEKTCLDMFKVTLKEMEE